MINFQIKLWASACTLAWVSACGGGGDGPPTPFLEPDAPTVPTAAGVIPCSEDDGLLGPVETYLTLPAEETHCKMTVHTATTYFSEVNRHIVGLSGGLENTLTEASRYAQPPDVTINDRILFTGQWLDVGTTGNAGELWWGRMLYPGEILGFYSHVSVGQLTWERKTHQMLQAGNLMGAVRMKFWTNQSVFFSPPNAV